jgi:hypothetical protein
MDNPETQATLGTRHRSFPFYIAPSVCAAQCCLCLWIVHSWWSLLCLVSNALRVSGLSILDFPLCNIGHQTQKGQSRMDNPETQATFGTRHRRGTQEWIIQRHRQHWALDTEGAIKNGQSRDTVIAPSVLSAQCCLCLWIVHSWLSLLCLVPNVACVCVSWLFILEFPFYV